MPGGNGVGQIIPPIVTFWLREVAGQQHQKKLAGPARSRRYVALDLSPGETSRSSSPRGLLRRASFAIISTKQNPKSPQTITTVPRVRAWAVFVRLTASENIHHLGRSAGPIHTSKADLVPALGHVQSVLQTGHFRRVMHGGRPSGDLRPRRSFPIEPKACT
jgi:hypothetical protein